MKIKKYKQSEKGFALALSLIMLLVMSLMGATLVMVAASDHKKNATKDSSQQAFYAAETGITEAKKWLAAQPSLSANNDPNGKLKFCKTSLFSNLSSPKAINNWVGTESLDKIIIPTGSDAKEVKKEEERLKKFSYEYFITYTPDKDGNTSDDVKREKSVTASTGSSIAEGTSYKTSGTNMGTHYTIFSCGSKQSDNIIVKLRADVVLVK